ncbi:MAG: hypothetical protein IKD61_09185 [Oscillospiraceae bacterium]|nr:hypothetical protein [Oscillospiraceae bacterium]
MPARREMPPEFPACATLSTRELGRRFGATNTTIAAWRRQLGIVVPPGAPKGNGNSVGNQSRRKKTHGIDDLEAVKTCLSCTAPRCPGKCIKVH